MSEMSENFEENVHQDNSSSTNLNNNNNNNNSKDIASSLANLHLGRINEIDAGNEADTEENEMKNKAKAKKMLKKQSSSTETDEDGASRDSTNK